MYQSVKSLSLCRGFKAAASEKMGSDTNLSQAGGTISTQIPSHYFRLKFRRITL